MKDRRKRRAGVLDVDVHVARQKGAIADERAAKIQPAGDGEAGVALYRLRQEFPEDHLLGKVLRTDDDRPRGPARE